MSLMMMLAVSGGKLKTQTFTASQTVVIPAGVDKLVSVTGEGADGTSASVQEQNTLSASVTYHAEGSAGTPGSAEWGNAQLAANSNQSAANAGGSIVIQELTLHKYADGTQSDSISNVPFENVIAGTAVTTYHDGWQSSGPITASGYASVTFDYTAPAAAGAAATGFGKTFPGGAPSTPATPTSYSNVAVTPGASYSLTIPSGGSITISYYE